MVEIQPYEFKKKTNIEEHNDIVSKVNEIVDVINDTQMDTIDSRLTAVEGDVTALESEVSTINNELDTKADKTEIPDTSTFATKTEVDTVDTKVDAIDSQLDTMQTEIDGLLKEVVDGVAMSSTAHGTVQVQINHEDGSNDISAPIDLGLVEEGGIVLKSGTTDRSFKLIVTLTDGTSWQTNDFVIPEGGGTDVSVTSISIAQGTGADKIQVKIGLSDGSTISSNDWTIVTPTQFSALGTRVTTAEGNITKNTGDISDLDSRVQALEGIDKTQIDTAAVASTVMFTADGSKVTLHADSLAGSEFTKDIPQASQGGAGTIDQASYAKIAATESKVNALAPSVTVNEETDPPTITVGINGKSSTANLPGGGGGSSGIEYVGTYTFTQNFDTPYSISASEGYLYILCLMRCSGQGIPGGGGNVALVSTAGEQMTDVDYSSNESIDFYTYSYNDMAVGATAKVTVRYENDQIRLYATGDQGSGGFNSVVAVYRVQLPTP